MTAAPTATPVQLVRKPTRLDDDTGPGAPGAEARAVPAAAPRHDPVRHAVLPQPELLSPELLALDAGEQYRFGFSMEACIGCHSCEVACAEQNGLPADTVWRRVGEVEGGDHPTTRRFHLSMSCNHCLDPACLEGCPTNAYEKLPNGIVAHHADDCIGCQYCTWNCPYSVPAFQPDRRIVTKCDLCRPRLDDGFAPACVAACPTHAITVEKVDVAAWRAEHHLADAPTLPGSGITLSTTRIELPAEVPADTIAASDWNLRPEHPHWPLIWLTLVSQVALGASLAAAVDPDVLDLRIAAFVLAAAGMAGALGHLGRPAMAWKAFRNLRRSWLSREVALLSLYAAGAGLAVLVQAAAVPAALAGVAGVFASARLYVVPGRPSWDTPLTVVRFFATTLATGTLLGDHRAAAIVGLVVALGATVANWWRLARRVDRAWLGSVRLDLQRLRIATLVRFAAGAVAIVVLASGGSLVVGFVAALACELLGRWLFFVTVVPLNMPGSFWRGAAGSHR